MTREDFISAINTSPHDAEMWLVYADWLEEAGDKSAVGWRRLVEQNRVLRSVDPENSWFVGESGSYQLPGYWVHSYPDPYAANEAAVAGILSSEG